MRCLVPLQQVDGQKLAAGGVDLDVSSDQRQQKERSHKRQEHGQPVEGEALASGSLSNQLDSSWAGRDAHV